MRLLVTGAAGFMGSDFVRLVLSRGEHEVVVLDALTYAGNVRNLSPVWEDPAFRFIRGDVCDPDDVCSAIDGSDAVIHFAAESDVDRSIGGIRRSSRRMWKGRESSLAHARDAATQRSVASS